MKRVWGHLLGGLASLAAAVAAMPACTHNDSTLFVQDVLAAQPVTQGQQCSFTSDPTQPFISSGVLDLALRNQYDAVFLIGNQMVAEANSQQLQTETSIITVQGAVVRITNAAGEQLANFTRLASATVYPASGTVPGYSPIGVTIIDSNTLASDSDLVSNVQGGGTTRLVTYVKFFGNTLGGKSVESDEFEFPVDVCMTTAQHANCLIGFSAADINPLYSSPNCLGNGGGTSSTTASLPAPCIPGQDTVIDCAQCIANSACNPKATPIISADAGPG